MSTPAPIPAALISASVILACLSLSLSVASNCCFIISCCCIACCCCCCISCSCCCCCCLIALAFSSDFLRTPVSSAIESALIILPRSYILAPVVLLFKANDLSCSITALELVLVVQNMLRSLNNKSVPLTWKLTFSSEDVMYCNLTDGFVEL